MRLLRLSLIFLAVLFGPGSGMAATDCSRGNGVAMKAEAETGGLAAYVETNPTKVPVGRPFEATISICGPGNVVVDRFVIDATMPRHRHGMNYTPKVSSADKRTHTATGLLFHMPGLWRIAVIVHSKSKRLRYTHDIVVE